MTTVFKNRIFWIWLLLVAATLISFEMFRGFGVDRRLAAVTVIVIAFVKVRFVGLDFMELRHAPLPLRLAFEIWAVVICTALIAIYWLGLH